MLDVLKYVIFVVVIFDFRKLYIIKKDRPMDFPYFSGGDLFSWFWDKYMYIQNLINI
jgi:hypothetical protein